MHNTQHKLGVEFWYLERNYSQKICHILHPHSEHQIASVMRICLRAGLEISFCCMWRAELNNPDVVLVVNEAYSK